MSIYTKMTDLELAVHKYLCVQALAPNQPYQTREAASKVLRKVIDEQRRRKET